MADKQIKSTLEIAMERVAKLPDLTPEEILERREKEFAPRGRAIASRYLEGALRHTDLEIEVSKFQDEERAIVRKSLHSSLCGAISLDDMDKSRKALRALQVLETQTGLEDKTGELEEIFTEYGTQRDRVLAEFQQSGQSRLRQLGISGSAVRPNPGVDPELQRKLRETRQAFSSRVEALRRELL